MRKWYQWGWFILLGASIQIGTVKKTEDPIINTQTNPIAHKDKLNELQEGEKAAPEPSFKLYNKESFLLDAPVEKFNNEEAEKKFAIPYLGDPIPENLGDSGGSEEEDHSFNGQEEN